MTEQQQTRPYRLFGVPGAEHLYHDIAGAYEAQVEPWYDEHDDRPVIIEEFSVHPPEYHMPSAEQIIEWLVEWTCENGEVDEGYAEELENRAKGQDVLVYADTLRKQVASLITYSMADKRLGEHQITWDENRHPLVDGQPLYTDAKGSSE